MWYPSYLTISSIDSNTKMHSAKNMANMIFAMPALAAAIPEKPRIPATIEMIKNRRASRSMISVLFYSYNNIISYQIRHILKAFDGMDQEMHTYL